LQVPPLLSLPFPDHAYLCPLLAYPDGHTDSLVDEDQEIAHLKEKVDAGADFIVTQLFYDVDGFLGWAKKVRQQGQCFNLSPTGTMPSIIPSGINVPIIPGIMPIQTYSSFLRLTKLCGTRVPPFILSSLDQIRVRSCISTAPSAVALTLPSVA